MHAAADSGCNETAQLMCERFKLRLCWLQRKSWFCGDARVMDVLLGLMHCWRCSGEPCTPTCRSEESRLIVNGRGENGQRSDAVRSQLAFVPNVASRRSGDSLPQNP